MAGGMHGANRLGGNSLSDLVVFGRIAGLGAANYAKDHKEFPKIADDQLKLACDELEQPFKNSGKNPYDIQEDMHTIISTNVGIFREDKDLKVGIAELENLKKDIANVKVSGSNLTIRAGIWP